MFNLGAVQRMGDVQRGEEMSLPEMEMPDWTRVDDPTQDRSAEEVEEDASSDNGG